MKPQSLRHARGTSFRSVRWPSRARGKSILLSLKGQRGCEEGNAAELVLGEAAAAKMTPATVGHRGADLAQ